MSSAEQPDDRPEYLRVFFPRPASTGRTATPHRLAPDQAAPYATKALNAEVEQLARTPEGGRNAALNTAAFNLAQLVAGGYLDHGVTWEALHRTAQDIGLSEAETMATLRSAFSAGERQPRVVAELDHYEAPQATVLHLVEGDQPVADAEPDADPEVVRRQRLGVVDWFDLWANEDEDEWIVRPLLPARRLVALYSAPKMGKSLLLLEMAVAISRGTTVLGEKVDRPRRVLYVDFENDPRGDIRQRLRQMGMTPYQLQDLVYLSFPQLAHLDTFLGGLELLEAVQAYQCEVVVIDTVSRAVGGEENDNDTWLGFYRNTGMRLKGAGVACIRLDHTGKDESKGMRGGSAKYGDVDAVWAMTKISDDVFRLECTANRLPISEKELVIRRRLHPLRHDVDTDAKAVEFKKAVAQAVEALDALKFRTDKGDGSGVRPARQALAGAGYSFVKGVVEKAQAERKARPTTWTYAPEGQDDDAE